MIDFDLLKEVDSVLELVAEGAYGKGLELANLSDNDLPRWLRGDPTRFRQILLNLVSNAVKFTEEGRVVVRASIARQLHPGVRLRFEVTDTGIGIPSEAAAKLFQSFSQADASTTRRYGGSGLGLAISRRLVEIMGGRIGMKSRAGRGSTFWFELPFESSAEQSPSAPLPEPSLSHVRALCVDDPTGLEIVRHLLENQVLELLCVESVPRALEGLGSREGERTGLDVTLLDVDDPDQDPESLLRALVGRVGTPRPPVIAITSQRSRRRGFVAAGASAVLFKPLRRDLLLRELQRALGLSSTQVWKRPASATREQYDLSLLLVEDNAVNQKVIGTMLGKLGCRFQSAVNGQEAVEHYSANLYDLVVMDCQMPVMDGYEATRRIRELERESGRRTPILAMTANAMKGAREECLEAGMDDYLTKPLSLDALSKVLARWSGALAQLEPQ
jgi:CheY-like chemotaxis protein